MINFLIWYSGWSGDALRSLSAPVKVEKIALEIYLLVAAIHAANSDGRNNTERSYLRVMPLILSRQCWQIVPVSAAIGTDVVFIFKAAPDLFNFSFTISLITHLLFNHDPFGVFHWLNR